MSKKINFKKLEKSFNDEIISFSEEGAFQVRTSLANLCGCIAESFTADEIAYFMFMLTDDGGEMKVEEKYLELMEDHYRKIATDGDGYEDYINLAEKYKEVIKEY